MRMKNPKLTVALLVLCFALWGLVNNMSDNLVPSFQKIFMQEQETSALVQVAFYGAYAVLALFTSILVQEFSFRAGILIGLGVYVCGALLYIPACLNQSFESYLVGIFIVAGGCAILEASSNSCMLAMGDPKSAIRRLNFAQVLNPVGSLVGIFIAQKAILANLNPATVPERLAMDPATRAGIVHEELFWVCVPYVSLCLVMLAIWIYFARHPIRTRMEEENATAPRAPLLRRLGRVALAIAFAAVPLAGACLFLPNLPLLGKMLFGMIGPFTCILVTPAYRASFFALLRRPRYVCGVLALFAYVGMQLGTWTYTNAYCVKTLGVATDAAANYYLLEIVFFILVCWGATYSMKWIAPWKIMAVFCVGGFASALGVVYLPAAALFTVNGLPFPPSVISLILINAFMSIVFPTIYGMALDGLDAKCFKLGGPGMVMAILGGAVIVPAMAAIIGAKDSVFFRLVQGFSFDFDANLRTSDAAVRASFYVPAICFVVMFLYAVVFRGSPARREA